MQQLYANEFGAIGAKKSSTENRFSMEDAGLLYKKNVVDGPFLPFGLLPRIWRVTQRLLDRTSTPYCAPVNAYDIM